jgi:hypothetical protein
VLRYAAHSDDAEHVRHSCQHDTERKRHGDDQLKGYGPAGCAFTCWYRHVLALGQNVPASSGQRCTRSLFPLTASPSAVIWSLHVPLGGLKEVFPARMEHLEILLFPHHSLLHRQQPAIPIQGSRAGT